MTEPRRLRLDTSALRESADFRLLFVSGGISLLGSMVTYVTLPLQVAKLTGSYVAVGVIGIIEMVPLIIFGLWGGAIADSANRKIIVIASESAMALCTLALIINTWGGAPKLWVLYVVALLFSALDGIQRPSLDALLPQIVPTRLLFSASALNSVRFNFSNIAGPAIGGFVAATLGPGWCYTIDLATFVIAIGLMFGLSDLTSTKSEGKVDISFVFSGFAYVRTRPDIIGTYLVDIGAMLFAFPNALFPFMADQYGAPWALGLLYASMSVGALTATLTSGWTSRIHHHGRAIVFAAIAWGCAIAGAGLTHNIWLALLCLVGAGGFDMVSALFRKVLWNTTIPLDMRGRLAGIELLSFSTGPQMGQVRSTFFARAFGLRASLISGGALCVASSVTIAAALRDLWNYDVRTNRHALAEKVARHEQI